jgi:hypothetical protein
MEDIFDTNSQFPFEKITLITPTAMTGGVYFSKILINKKQLYIQSPKCKTKQGIIKSGKKNYADLVFTNDDEEFIQWIDSFEQTVKKHIYTNREKWFDMDLDEDDVDNYFSPTVKFFKSGKQYIMRVNISQRIGSSPLKIYDENEMDVEMESINENTQLITILEIQGVRCSTKSFQIDIELKQIMVLKPVNLFEKCIIKSKQSKENLEKDLVNNKTETNSVKTPNIKILTVETPIVEPQRNEVPIDEDFVDNNVIKMHISELSKDETSKDETSKDKIPGDEMSKNETSRDETSKDEIPGDEMSRDETSRDETSQAQTHVDELFKNDTSDILEIDLDIDEIETSNIFHLKEKTEIYYQMYKEARQKAKLAKSLALSSYLEARRIKNLYMLDNIDESDESDLEDLDNLEK